MGDGTGLTWWELSCPACYRRWVVKGRGRWLKYGGRKGPRHPGEPWTREGPSRPADDESSEWFAHYVRRDVFCEDCRERRDAEGAERLKRELEPELAASLAANQRQRIERFRAMPIAPDGTKLCVRCQRVFKPGRRSDACYCSRACKEAVRRRLARLDSGRLPSDVMNRHDRKARPRNWPW